MSDDLIRRSDAIKIMACEMYAEAQSQGYEVDSIEDFIPEAKAWMNDAPSADRPKGKWIAKDGVFYCSCCDNDSAGLSEEDVYVYRFSLPNYCQDCGANMKGTDDEIDRCRRT